LPLDFPGICVLFNSQPFLLVFLPVTLAGYFLLGTRGAARAAVAWLTVASLVFYGWWNPAHVPLLLGSMAFNYAVGRRLGRHPSRPLLIAGIAANVLLLGVFKYTGFVVGTLNQATGAAWAVPHIVLPLAISFFTFQQIAYLSDANDGVAVEHDFLNYCLFVTFFPHLIAGPITHHREMLPQFADRSILRPRLDLLSIGGTLFLLGLFKKVMIADQIGTYAAPVFAAAAQGEAPTLLPAWGGALAYALQIYFDFSGYTDMAIGLGLMFGISLPPNFDSPYKARSIIEFWSRWHMTLTRFLTAYIYNPLVLAMTRRRARAGLPLPRRGRISPGTFAAIVAFPTLLTMFVSGVWHGAGWQFIAFGVLHGLYLSVNHGWRALKAHRGWPAEGKYPALARPLSVLLTFLCVVVALVFFRAADVPAALAMLSGMAGQHGWVVDWSFYDVRGLHRLIELLDLPRGSDPHFKLPEALAIAALLAAVWTLPNTQQWMRLYRTALDMRHGPSWLERVPALPFTLWRPGLACGALFGLVGFFALARALSVAPSEFLYFQF
jgi:D-alanyl-lipoteichoic acid acyltransferase DltB (MBOAT superfamily)